MSKRFKNKFPIFGFCLSVNPQFNLNSPFKLKIKTKIGKLFLNHLFNHAKYKNDTELSKEFWEIKKRIGTPKITGKIIRICRPYNPNSKGCLLGLNEKYGIATYKGDNLLNKRNEIINTCRHRSK